jgi:hypothetical protein
MQVVQYQASLFPKALDFSDPSRFITEVGSALKDDGVVFNSQQILPYQSINPKTQLVTNGLQLVAQATARGLEIQATSEKISIILNALNDNDEPELQDFNNIIKRIIDTDTLSPEIFNRVGFISTRVKYTDDFSTAGKYIFVDDLSRGLESFNTTLEYKIKNSNDYINVFIIVSTVIRQPDEKKGISILTDTSTPVEGKRITTDRIPALLDNLSKSELTDSYIDAMRIDNGDES